MGDWRDHVVPDWVADEYNKHVPRDERIPTTNSSDDFSDLTNYPECNYHSNQHYRRGVEHDDYYARRFNEAMESLAIFLVVVGWFIGMYFFIWLLS